MGLIELIVIILIGALLLGLFFRVAGAILFILLVIIGIIILLRLLGILI